jgi:hypothetical protein
MTKADGFYQLELPSATYTIKAHGTTSSGAPLKGQAEGVVVAAGSEVTVDVTVSEQQT